MLDSPIAQTLVGGVLALAGSLGATFYAKHLDRKYLAKQFANAIKGELTAIFHIADRRAYVSGLRAVADEVEQTGVTQNFFAPIRDEYCRVYKGNIEKLGILPPGLACDVAVVYTQILAVIEDFHVLEQQVINPAYQESHISQLGRFRTMADLLEDSSEKARGVISEIERIYGK